MYHYNNICLVQEMLVKEASFIFFLVYFPFWEINMSISPAFEVQDTLKPFDDFRSKQRKCMKK